MQKPLKFSQQALSSSYLPLMKTEPVQTKAKRGLNTRFRFVAVMDNNLKKTF